MFLGDMESCVVHQQRPTRPTCRTSTDLGHPCVHGEFQMRCRNGKKSRGSAVHSSASHVGHGVGPAFRTLSLDGHFGRLWALVARGSLCNHGE